MTGDAEARRGDLLDRATAPVSIRIADETCGIFAAFAGVTFATDPIHRDGEIFVRFLANGAERHRARFESLYDLCRRLNFLDRNRRLRWFEFEQAAQRRELTIIVIDCGSVILEKIVVARAH